MSFPALLSKISDATGNLFYSRPGLATPEIPTPFFVGDWHFPGFNIGGIDYAGNCVANSMRLVVVGDGTLTWPIHLGGFGTCDPLTAYVRYHIAGQTQVTVSTQVIYAGDTVVFNISTEAQAHCVNWVDIVDNINGQNDCHGVPSTCGHYAFGYGGGASWVPA